MHLRGDEERGGSQKSLEQGTTGGRVFFTERQQPFYRNLFIDWSADLMVQ